MSAADPISYVSTTPLDSKFLVADGQSRDITINMYTYQWWSSVSGIAIFHIRCSHSAGPPLYVVLTPSGQEIRPTHVGNSSSWSISEFAFKVGPTRPFIQFVVCPFANTNTDTANLEGTNYRVEHAAMSDVLLDGVPMLVGAPRTYSAEEALEVCGFPTLPPR
jgi:hypothetical protein